MLAQLRKHLIIAQEKEPSISHMKCLIDRPGRKLADKLYAEYISKNNMGKFPLFMAKLDALLTEFGGSPTAVQDEESESEDDDGSQPNQEEETEDTDDNS